jgi:hypothetical protein
MQKMELLSGSIFVGTSPQAAGQAAGHGDNRYSFIPSLSRKTSRTGQR